MKSLFKTFLLVTTSIAIFYISLLSYKSSVAQRKIIIDLSDEKVSYTFDEIDQMLNGFPNISATALPIDIWKVQYLLYEGKYEKAKTFVKKATKVNPHVYVGEYLQGQIFNNEGKIDSAFYYSKKAFFGWPKNLNHYNSYVDVLEKKQDTSSLIEAFNSLDSTLKKTPEYFKRFYSSFNKIKLSYLITDYPNERTISKKDLINKKWSRVYNFPNNQVIRDTSLTYYFVNENTVLNKKNQAFLFNIKNDTFNFYYKSRPEKSISSFKVKYSDEYKTMIFYQVPIENNRYQDQYFKIIE